MRVLGIETSCDETAVAIYDGDHGLMGHALHSQIELHQRYGGVVPELASRDHILKLLPLIEDLLENASLTLKDLDAIAYTAGPGLVGALLVGACCAQALGYSLGIPTVPIHHMEGHLLAPLLDDPKPTFPFLALLVSGGHTMLIQANAMGQYQLLGETLDDAAGEAFDKIAKLMGLNYPGGPELAKLALGGQPHRFQFPRPLTDKPGLNFSFSGLKTHALTTLKKLDKSSGEDHASWQDRADIAHAFQEAIVDTLYIKCKRALEHTGLQQVVIAGGVSANLILREKFRELQKLGVQVYYPRIEFCTDNGAMIAFAGYQRLSKDAKLDLKTDVRARWPLNEL